MAVAWQRFDRVWGQEHSVQRRRKEEGEEGEEAAGVRTAVRQALL